MKKEKKIESKSFVNNTKNIGSQQGAINKNINQKYENNINNNYTKSMNHFNYNNSNSKQSGKKWEKNINNSMNNTNNNKGKWVPNLGYHNKKYEQKNKNSYYLNNKNKNINEKDKGNQTKKFYYPQHKLDAYLSKINIPDPKPFPLVRHLKQKEQSEKNKQKINNSKNTDKKKNKSGDLESKKTGRIAVLNELYYYSSLREQEVDSYLQDCIDESEEIQNKRDFLFANLFNRSGYRCTTFSNQIELNKDKKQV